MSAQLLDGRSLAARLKERLANDIVDLKDKKSGSPCIVSIVIGDDPGTLSYVSSQQKTAEALGIKYVLKRLPADVNEEYLVSKVLYLLNEDKDVHGILLNKPVPDQIDFEFAAASIEPSKNVEGINGYYLGRLLLGETTIVPCTAAAAVELLRSAGVLLKGKHAVVLGRSEIVGKPVAILLLQEDMTVTVCHSKTTDLVEHLKRADVVVAAIGKASFLKGDMLKEGVIIVDVGINRVDGKIVGDVDLDSCKDKASYITPVPGGVGPVTAVMLMKNVVEAFKKGL